MPWCIIEHPGTDGLVFVDGRFRVACSLKALRRLENQTGWSIAVDDYFGRPHYTVLEEILPIFEKVGRIAIVRPSAKHDKSKLESLIHEYEFDFR